MAECCEDPAIRRGCGCQARIDHLWERSQTPEAAEFLKRRTDTWRDDEGPDAA